MKTEKAEEKYLISETARLVGVESHVLRYWEEELKLPIRRNELGHRYYTSEDVDQFRQIKKMKEQGLQLKAIRTVLTDSSMQVMVPLQSREIAGSSEQEEGLENASEEGDKGARLQMLLHNMISQAVRENNKELTREIRETILKELDYQFRVQDEENRKRDEERTAREEEHFRKLDEKLREYSKRKPGVWERRRREKEKREPGKEETAVGKGSRPPRIPPLFGIKKKHPPM